MTSEAQQLVELLISKTPLVAMLAPSFPVMYEYPEIITRLRLLGFPYVLEVTAGADLTNKQAVAVLKADPQARLITSPCPSVVRMVRTKYPELIPYLGFAADSPMVATAKIVREKFPDRKPIFLGPCNAKKLEAGEDYPELEILALNYKQLDEVLDHFNLSQPVKPKKDEKFDVEFKQTRLYPISGGLAQSAKVKDVLAADELEVVSGWNNCQAALERFKTNDKIRLLDILFCEGGCINGPGIDSQLTLPERREKVMQFWQTNNLSLLWSNFKNIFLG